MDSAWAKGMGGFPKAPGWDATIAVAKGHAPPMEKLNPFPTPFAAIYVGAAAWGS